MNTGNADRSHESLCDDFMARHSEYLDGLLPPVIAARLDSHAAACASCGHYDRVVRRGLALIRDLPDVAPSEDFEMRLQHRLFHVQDAVALVRPRPVGAAAALGIAAAIALVAWSPFFVARAETDAVPSAVSQAASVFDGAPLFRDAGWYPVALSPATAQRPSALLAAFPGPYSPLVVTPPVHRSVRSVSSEYAPFD